MRQADHQLALLKGSEGFFQALVQAFDASVREIRLETYIFHPEASVIAVAQALVRAANRGVAVYVLFDGAGTPTLAPAWRQAFDDAGVRWRIFRPLGWAGVLFPRRWRRLHRKLCVVDGRIGFCGGINLIDDYLDPNHGHLQQPRLDFAVQVIGPLVRTMHATMYQLWWRTQVSFQLQKADLRGAWRDLQRARLGDAKGTMAVDPQPGASAKLVLRDNLRNRTQIERAYRRALACAQSDVLIANAYFLPGRKILESLIHVARRGVRVRLLLQGRYEYFIPFHAARALYVRLLAAGIEIYEYRPSFLHAKVAVVDGHWVTVGSSNIDPLSLLLAREANVVIDDRGFAQGLLGHLDAVVREDAVRVDAQAYAQRAWHVRWLDRIALLLMRLTLFLIGLRY